MVRCAVLLLVAACDWRASPAACDKPGKAVAANPAPDCKRNALLFMDLFTPLSMFRKPLSYACARAVRFPGPRQYTLRGC